MEHYVGLDVSQEQTAVCVIDEAGQIVWQGRCASMPEAIATAVRAKAPQAKRIGLEAGPLSSWHWHTLRALGLPVVCLDARARQGGAGRPGQQDGQEGCLRAGPDRADWLVPGSSGQEL